MWQVSITNGMQAHFRQEDGSTRPGTDWVVVINGEGKQGLALVRTWSDKQPRRSDEEQAAMAAAYVSQQLENRWVPEWGAESSQLIVPDDFVDPANPPARKPWWKFW